MLASCLESGDFTPLQTLYATDAAMEAHLPIGRREARGPDEIVSELGRWWPAPGRLSFWQERPAPSGTGTTVRFERSSAMGDERQRHLLHLRDGLITWHIVYPERVERADQIDLAVDDTKVAEFLEGVVEQTSLGPVISGGSLVRVRRADGISLVVKRLMPGESWIGRATEDRGREAQLWLSGAAMRFPASIDHGILAAAAQGGGWLLVMRDVSDALIGPGTRLDRDTAATIVRAMADLHRAFAGEVLEGLCTLEDRYRLFSPETAKREGLEPDFAPKVVGRGWELFGDVAAPDIREAVLSLVERPDPLVAALRSCQQTLIHGDLRPANLGFADGRVVVLDWGLAARAPAAVDFGWFLFNTARNVDATHEDLLDDVRGASGGSFDERAMDLALLGTLVQAGCYFGFEALQNPDQRARYLARAELGWWELQARRCLERWPLL